MLLFTALGRYLETLSGGRSLEYCVKDVLLALTLNRTQLTLFGIVSHNDNNRNVYGVGCETSYRIIKRMVSKCTYTYVFSCYYLRLLFVLI